MNAEATDIVIPERVRHWFPLASQMPVIPTGKRIWNTINGIDVIVGTMSDGAYVVRMAWLRPEKYGDDGEGDGTGTIRELRTSRPFRGWSAELFCELDRAIDAVLTRRPWGQPA